MDSTATRIEASVPSHAAFDALTRSVGARLPRRRAVGLLAATLGAGLFGLAAAADDAAAKRKKNGKRRNRRRNQGNQGNTGNNGNNNDDPQQQPDASASCLAVNNTCGTNANLQGRCRLPIAADNDANFVCTSNTAGNACTSSLQCGAGTRCVINAGVATCRVIIP